MWLSAGVLFPIAGTIICVPKPAVVVVIGSIVRATTALPLRPHRSYVAQASTVTFIADTFMPIAVATMTLEAAAWPIDIAMRDITARRTFLIALVSNRVTDPTVVADTRKAPCVIRMADSVLAAGRRIAAG